MAKFAQMQDRANFSNDLTTKIIFGLVAAAFGTALFYALLGDWHSNQLRVVAGDPILATMLCCAKFSIISVFAALGFAAPLMFAAEKAKEKAIPKILQIFWVLIPDMQVSADQSRPNSSFRPPRHIS